jgi:hypothetical protein
MLHRYHTSRRWPIPELLRLPGIAGPDSSDPSAVRHLVRPRLKAASVVLVFVKSSHDLLLFKRELPHFIDSASPVSSCHICAQLAFRVEPSISVPRMYQHVNSCRPPTLVAASCVSWASEGASPLMLQCSLSHATEATAVERSGLRIRRKGYCVSDQAHRRGLVSAIPRPPARAIGLGPACPAARTDPRRWRERHGGRDRARVGRERSARAAHRPLPRGGPRSTSSGRARTATCGRCTS